MNCFTLLNRVVTQESPLALWEVNYDYGVNIDRPDGSVECLKREEGFDAGDRPIAFAPYVASDIAWGANDEDLINFPWQFIGELLARS